MAGLKPHTYEPYIGSSDSIGCITEPEDFVVAGTAAYSVYGMCEGLWEKNMVFLQANATGFARALIV